MLSPNARIFVTPSVGGGAGGDGGGPGSGGGVVMGPGPVGGALLPQLLARTVKQSPAARARYFIAEWNYQDSTAIPVSRPEGTSARRPYY
jgi:hypothetical protein